MTYLFHWFLEWLEMMVDDAVTAVIYPEFRCVYLIVVGTVGVFAWGSGLFFAFVRGRIDLVDLLVLFFCVLFFCRLARSRVVLTPAGLVVWRLAWEKRVSWGDVGDFRVVKTAGMRRLQLVLSDGKVVGLPAPSEMWPTRGEGFDGKIEVMLAWKARCG
ncbi:hypothetical protein [Actinomadura roseirufa]|uniref:hypothetical protein n=1 Tax=Actinomadura roseirufa TaxID=2094049 RepID=UPI0010418693|nr:hypothetical protein [Actinomadura roseirufa]